MMIGKIIDDTVMCDDCGKRSGACIEYNFTFNNLKLCIDCNIFEDKEILDDLDE